MQEVGRDGLQMALLYVRVLSSASKAAWQDEYEHRLGKQVAGVQILVELLSNQGYVMWAHCLTSPSLDSSIWKMGLAVVVPTSYGCRED